MGLIPACPVRPNGVDGVTRTVMDVPLGDAPPEDVDWPEAWRQHLLRSGLEANLRRIGITQEDFWNRLSTWSRKMSGDGYPGLLLERVERLVQPGDRVLDIGAGAGAFSIPLARIVGQVTAVEPSPVQSALLKSRVQSESLHNLAVLEQRWEDVDLAMTDACDLVLAVHSFQMEDIRGMLSRMVEATRRSLLLIHTAGHDLSETLADLFGLEAGPGYIYIYNVLCRMGYRPDVEFVTRKYLVPLDGQLDMFRYNPGLDEEQCAVLRDYLTNEGRISVADGEPMIERSHRDAVMYVNKQPQPEAE